MPPFNKPSYKLHGRFTGSILLLGLTSLTGGARASELEPVAALSAEISAAVTNAAVVEAPAAGAELSAEPAQSKQNPEGAILRLRVSLPSHPEFVAQADLAPEVAAPTDPVLAAASAVPALEPALSPGGEEIFLGNVPTLAPEVGTTIPGLPGLPSPMFTPAEAAIIPGMPVPWYTAQIPPGTGPSVAAPPEYGAYYPAVPYPGGTWVMVWMPYGAPGVPAAGITPAGANGLPQPAAGVPTAVPYGIAPQAYSVGVVPWGAVPNPYGYGAAPAYPQMAPGGYGAVPVYTQPPPGYGAAQYPQTAPAGAPLSVPALPNSTTAGTLPPQPAATSGLPLLPPVVPGTYLPPENSSGSSPLGQGVVGQRSGLEGAPLAPDAAIAPPALPEPNLNIQGLYVLQGDNASARARVSGDAFLTPNLLVGGALDLVTGPDLTNRDGVQLTELYLATSVPGAPGLRFRLGQLDLTSYFDRNSFSKDISRDFFNAAFQTSPALIAGANATASRPGGLVQWAVTDDITLNAAVFSSAANITDFALDGFAGEVAFRTGDLILRGTFITSRDTEFQNTGGRLDAYGINAEWFIPEANLGLFGRYGQLNNSGSGFSGDSYSFGLNLFDVFMADDRLGLGYGRNLSTAAVDGRTPDALELFYDFELIPNLRLGFTFQQRNQFQESFAGFRIRSDFNLLPGRSLE
ncbi:MAG: carbohydrate porin [Nodosilinea sp.]